MRTPRRRNPDAPVRIRLVGFGKPRAIKPEVEAFLRDLFDASYPNPLGGSTPTERILSGIEVLVDVLPEHNGVHIDRLRALTRKQGEGTKAMRFLTSLADKHGVKLSLYAKPFGSEAMNRDTLVNVYRRFSFYPDEAEEEDEGTEMYRWPRQTPSREPLRSNPARKPSQTDTPAFKRWFGASTVVDAKGQPLVVYHGTPVGGFDTFVTHGNGIFFSDDPKVAWSYTVSERKPRVLTKKRLLELQGRGVGQDTPALYASYLRMENPLVVDAEGSDWQVISVYGVPAGVRDAVRAAADDAYASTLSTDQLVEAAQVLGYDGVIVKRTWDLGGWGGDADHPSTIYAIFDPKQVKSANMNDGTFNPDDPSLLRNPASRNPARKAKPPMLAAAGLPEVWFHGTQKTFGKLKAQGGACIWLADKAGAMAYATPHYGRRSAIRLIEVALAPDTRVVDLADASDPAVRSCIHLDASERNMRWHGREDVTDAEMADAVARWNARRTHYDAIEARSWAKAHFRKAGADALLVRDVAGWGGHETMPSLCLLNPKKVLGEQDVAPDLSLVRAGNMPKYENPRSTTPARRKVT